MKLRLTHDDASETIQEVSSASILFDGGWVIDIRPAEEARRLTLHAPAGEDIFPSFVVHHRCANTMDVELAIHQADDNSQEES
jgi:hypothetical protein